MFDEHRADLDEFVRHMHDIGVGAEVDEAADDDTSQMHSLMRSFLDELCKVFGTGLQNYGLLVAQGRDLLYGDEAATMSSRLEDIEAGFDLAYEVCSMISKFPLSDEELVIFVDAAARAQCMQKVHSIVAGDLTANKSSNLDI